MNPRILLVEDDATSAAFLAAATEALPARVDVVATCAGARRAAAATDYALWLIDAHLPDGSGGALLASLRADGYHTPALGHTADPDAPALQALREAGFADAFAKPLTTAQLHVHLCRALPARLPRVAEACPGPAPVWDDEAAIAALNGSAGNVQALRALCLGELPRASTDIGNAFSCGDVASLQQVLHRLRASCGFVGARRLGDAVRALQGAPHCGQACARVQAAIEDMLQG